MKEQQIKLNPKDKELDDHITKVFGDKDIIQAAIRAAVNAALLKHKQTGNPVCESRNGKVIWIDLSDETQK